MFRSLRRTLHRMFPRYRTSGPEDPSGDTTAQNKEPGFTDVAPGVAPTTYVRAYDEGRPKH